MDIKRGEKMAMNYLYLRIISEYSHIFFLQYTFIGHLLGGMPHLYTKIKAK